MTARPDCSSSNRSWRGIDRRLAADLPRIIKEKRDMLRLSRSHRSRLRIRMHRTLFGVELLEDRSLLAQSPEFTVTNTQDSGTGSLRAAITQVNSDLADPSAGPDQIDFCIPTTDPGYNDVTKIWTITLSSALPTITNPVIIDGTSQPDYLDTPIIAISGVLKNEAGLVSGNGLVLGATANGCTIEGLTIDSFGFSGILIDSGGNIVENNVVSSNGGSGIVIDNKGGNIVRANKVLDNGGNGVELDFANGNLIGATDGTGNTISGNTGSGIRLDASSFVSILGNLIGTEFSMDVNGNSLLNFGDGVDLNGGSDNTIGGTDAGAGNLICGNVGSGISLTQTLLNQVLGNFIGTSTVPVLPNLGDGVDVSNSASNTIGGSALGAANVISGNEGDGILFSNFATFNEVVGNFIGTNKSGTLDPDLVDNNNTNGVVLTGLGSDTNTIGGTATGDGNVISGNLGSGILFTNNANDNQVAGNFIGTNATGTRVANGGDGVDLLGVQGELIGGTTAGARNIISGNNRGGIDVADIAEHNQIVGNYIGTDSSGLKPLFNGGAGVALDDAFFNTIGAPVTEARNLISGNMGYGISVSDSAGVNEILGNFIGTNGSGTKSLPNRGDGVNLANVSGNTIGGTATGDRNVISGNGGSGINLTTAANGNLVVGNYIGTDMSGESPVGNVDGISINAAIGNIIGGTASGAANVISGNTSIGIQISNSLATDNSVLGNLIGTDKDGTRVVPSPGAMPGFPVGILINDSPANMIGGTTAGAGNVISGFGVAVNISSFNASGNAIEGNRIGTTQNGDVLTNANVIGIYINGAGKNFVGGGTRAAGNTIMGYTDYGIYLFGSQSTGNVVQGNQIGQRVAPKKLAAKHPAQQLAGIGIQGASSNMIGGPTSAMRNTILGNASAGVYIFGQANSASNNKIQNNLLDNNAYGILLYNAANNGQYFTLQRTNRFGKNPIADIREFTGPVPRGAHTRKQGSTSSRKHGHPDVRIDAPRHQSPQSRDAGRAKKL